MYADLKIIVCGINCAKLEAPQAHEQTETVLPCQDDFWTGTLNGETLRTSVVPTLTSLSLSWFKLLSDVMLAAEGPPRQSWRRQR